MLRRPVRCPRDGIGLEHRAFVIFVIFQDGIRLRCQRVTVMSIRINIHRDHVGPLLEVVLAFGRELMLAIHRPAVQITNAPEGECGLPWRSSSARLFRIEEAGRDSY